MAATNGMIDTDDAVILLIDHQSGLFNTVRDVPVPDLRNYVTAIAKVATLLNIPVITTASVPDGPNGPLIPEIHKYAPHAVYVPRTGQINTWDNPAFVKEVEKTGRKTLIIAGTLTSVCMAFPAVSAVHEGIRFTVLWMPRGTGPKSRPIPPSRAWLRRGRSLPIRLPLSLN